MRTILFVCATLLVAVGIPSSAQAFCGFYVGGAGADLFNNATQVVLMRHGTRTVLSMQNNYQGPPTDFAMVVPVPVVLQKENVKTLSDDVFARVDKLAAPRLVEYWETDPCLRERRYKSVPTLSAPTPEDAIADGAESVTVEAQFKVGEYDIVILSATEASGLDAWLNANNYNIPKGAEPYLRPYVQGGMKFFVAKVDTAKVTFVRGMAKLSPLRFHYDSEAFQLPIRLGMMNSAGTQDLIVHILAKGQRYEVANYKNATIPTNLDVKNEVRTRFGEFYAALFDRTLEKNSGAVVTEYSWDASTCDPCPEPPLQPAELLTLGGDVLDDKDVYGFVLTRLHARYSKDGVKDDLVFKAAPPIVGGREMRSQAGLETGSRPGGHNNFQGRYAIRHSWTGPISCSEPIRGRWGGPPQGGAPRAQPALELAFAPRGSLQLASAVAEDIPEIGVEAGKPRIVPKVPVRTKSGCAGCGNTPAGAGMLFMVLVVAFALRTTARRRL